MVLFLQLLDDLQVLIRNVIIVLLHLTESRFMIDHEVIDVLVFALLDFVQLNLHTKFKLFLEGDLLLLVELNERLLVGLELMLKRVQILLMLLCLLLNLANVRLIVPFVVLFLVLLALSVV